MNLFCLLISCNPLTRGQGNRTILFLYFNKITYLSLCNWFSSASLNLYILFLLIWNVFILGTTGKDTIESAGLWLDHTESLPFSQFLCQCRFLPILHYRIIIFVFIILILCYDLLAISWQALFFSFSSMRSICISSGRTKAESRGQEIINFNACYCICLYSIVNSCPIYCSPFFS